MADLATIINLPRGTGEYATVKDPFGNLVTVKKESLPSNAEEGKQFAYKVEFSDAGRGQWTIAAKDK